MAVKDELLKLLYFYPSNYISGEKLARRLGISRNAVYKHIQELRKEGYDIQACTNRGYALQVINDVLSPAELVRFFPMEKEKIRIFSSLPSTNATAKEMAACGAPEGTLCIAETQTKGRGRMSRQFFSPKQTGLYMSIILRPNLDPSDALLITTLAAVAVAEAAEMLTGLPAQIKWVNDVYMNGRKVSGILTEAAFNMETRHLDYVVLGIGVNLYTPKEDFPAPIQNIAGSLFSAPLAHARCRVAACILERFYYYYNQINSKNFLKEYQERSLLDGHTVEVIQGSDKYIANVLGVNNDFSLRLLLPSGQIKNLASGEVSVKLEKH